jgi:hypothetical protein
MPGYVDYLERKAASKGKPPRWAKNVRQLGKQLLLPKWANWTLRAECWHIIEARLWFVQMVAKDYEAELSQLNREIEVYLSD